LTKVNIIFICNFFSIFSYYLRTENASQDHVWRELSLHMQLFNYPLLLEEDSQLLNETIHLDLLITYLNIVLLCFSKHLPRKAEEIRSKHFFFFFFWKLCRNFAQAIFVCSCEDIEGWTGRLLQWYLIWHVLIVSASRKSMRPRKFSIL